ncbi:MAG: hypothetical protein WCJ14_09750 [Verrucomicrobiota bacterium]
MMNTRLMPSPREAATLDTAALRSSFLLDDLFVPGALGLVYTDLDRAVVGSAIPTTQPLELGADDALKADYFCQRRELGILNLGETGSVVVDGTTYQLGRHDWANPNKRGRCGLPTTRSCSRRRGRSIAGAARQAIASCGPGVSGQPAGSRQAPA